jgi:hypothetical protein
VDALEDLMVRLSVLGGAHSEVAERDCDPVMVSSDGAVVMDARVCVRSSSQNRPFPALDR